MTDLFFDTFWSTYPRKAGKIDAQKAWAKVTRHVNPQDVIDGAQRYRDDKNREEAFTKLPATWLRAGCWEDDPLPPRPQPTNGFHKPEIKPAYHDRWTGHRADV